MKYWRQLSRARCHLKAVYFEALLGSETIVTEKLRNVVSLISLKLNHFSILGMFDDGPVARKLLLQRLHDALLVKLLSDTLCDL